MGETLKIQERTRKLITEKHHFDVELYEFAHRLIDEAITAQSDDFNEELMRFRSASPHFSPGGAGS